MLFRQGNAQSFKRIKTILIIYIFSITALDKRNCFLFVFDRNEEPSASTSAPAIDEEYASSDQSEEEKDDRDQKEVEEIGSQINARENKYCFAVEDTEGQPSDILNKVKKSRESERGRQVKILCMKSEYVYYRN